MSAEYPPTDDDVETSIDRATSRNPLGFVMSEVVHIAKLSADELDSPLLKAIDIGKRVQVRARGISTAPAQLRPSEGFTHWGNYLSWCTSHAYDAVVLVTGPTGSGKSTLALRWCQTLDTAFTIAERLCYSAEELLKVYETILPGQCVLFDEGVRGLLAGDQNTTEQKALIQALALIREKGAILFICAPSIWNVAKQVRQNRARLWVHVQGRGLALVHERNDRLRYVPDATLGFSRSEDSPYVQWTAYAKTSKFNREYLRIKHAHLDAYLRETREMLENRRRRGRGKRGKEDGAAPPAAPPGAADAAAAAPSSRVETDAAVLEALEGGASYKDIYRKFPDVNSHRVAKIKRTANLP